MKKKTTEIFSHFHCEGRRGSLCMCTVYGQTCLSAHDLGHDLVKHPGNSHALGLFLSITLSQILNSGKEVMYLTIRS